MKIKKKIITFSISLLIIVGSVTGVFASYVYGTSYQTVSMVDIPGGGKAKYNMTLGSKKATNENFATFLKTYGEAMLGNFGVLVNSSKDAMTGGVGMPLNTPVPTQEHGCSKGTVYYLAVLSSTIEPSNTCDVTVKFSADNLKK